MSRPTARARLAREVEDIRARARALDAAVHHRPLPGRLRALLGRLARATARRSPTSRLFEEIVDVAVRRRPAARWSASPAASRSSSGAGLDLRRAAADARRARSSSSTRAACGPSRRSPPAWIAEVLDRCATVFLSTDAFHAEGVGDGRYVRRGPGDRRRRRVDRRAGARRADAWSSGPRRCCARRSAPTWADYAELQPADAADRRPRRERLHPHGAMRRPRRSAVHDWSPRR